MLQEKKVDFDEIFSVSHPITWNFVNGKVNRQPFTLSKPPPYFERK